MVKNDESNQRSVATLTMIVAMAIFGSVGFVAAKTNLLSFELVFVRCMCATLFLGLIWLISGKYKQEQWNVKEVIQTAVCGVILVLNWIFLFKAFEAMSVTVAISIYYLAPVLVLLLGSAIYREKLTILSVFSVIICFVGTILVSGIGEGVSFNELLSSGIFWACLAALFYAFLMLLSKGIKKMSSYAVTFIQTFIGTLVLLPFVDTGAFSGLSQSNWIAILTIGLVHTGIVYSLFFGSVRYLPARLISALVFLDPGVAILLDTAFTGFKPSVMQTIGVILIFSGMALTLLKSKPKLAE